MTTIDLGRTAITGWATAGIALASLGLLLVWHAKAAVVGVLALAGVAGWLLLRVA